MRVLFICGKGGTGKTAITGGFSHFFSKRGGALAISLDWSESFRNHLEAVELTSNPIEVKPGLYATVLDRHTILTEYITGMLALKPFRKWIINHPLYPSLSEILPGFREVLLIDKIFSYALSHKHKSWNTIIVDMPSTGFTTNLFASTLKASHVIAHAPLLKRIRRNCDYLSDPAFTRLIVVTVPEETPVQESREMILELQNRCSMVVDTIIVNRHEADILSEDTINWITQTSSTHLEYLLTHCIQSDVSAESLKYIVNLERQRKLLANTCIATLKKWWQEPLLIMPSVDSFSSGKVSKTLCRHISESGYHG